uniref:Glycosyl transferase family 25 domain-containing protein n=1 Tax=viral metagenome TaxID=1070528 RepID=A0A6C0I4U5_9ZZZZ
MSRHFDIYVINLDKDVSRLEEMTQALKPNHFTRIAGILGKDLDQGNAGGPSLDDVFYTSRFFAPRGAIGCSLSHRKALTTFLQTSKKEYALILEDDAKPTTQDYVTEVQKAIENAPKDWGIIKLDSWPRYSSTEYTTLPSLLTTAYVINRSAAKKWLEYKSVFHIDMDMWFYNIKIYTCPTIVFQQVWDEKYTSNNRSIDKVKYNPLAILCDPLDGSFLRIGNFELTIADLLVLLIVGVIYANI